MYLRKLFLNVPIILVEIMTVLLLGYIAYGEVNRRYPTFLFDKMAAQAETLKNSLDPLLQAGIPIEQFSAFNSQSEALIQSDPDIRRIAIFSYQSKDAVFSKGEQRNSEDIFNEIVRDGDSKSNTQEQQRERFQQSNISYQVILPLVGKFGKVGYIELETDKSAVTRVVLSNFKHVIITGTAIIMIFSLLVFAYSALAERFKYLRRRHKQVINSAYLISFLAISVVVALTIFAIYENGARAKTKALADAMAQRISAVLELGIQLEDISGINQVFMQYQRDNPDINVVALTRNEEVLFHTDETLIGQYYKAPRDSYEYKIKLLKESGHEFHLAVTIPIDIVLDAVLERGKEFFVLLIACGLISWVFLDAGTGILLRLKQGSLREKQPDCYEIGLRLIKPAYFLIVFTFALPLSFLPPLVIELAGETQSELASGTLPFTIYYFVFAAVLIPAGRYAEKGNLKRMMALGFIAELIGLILVASSDNYWIFTGGRIFSGFGQGVFLIGLNSYTLIITPKSMRTQGAAVKVNGRNAGLISGTAIGALLYAYMGYQAIFIIASVISLIGIFYLWYLVPGEREIMSVARQETLQAEAKKTKKKKANSLSRDIIAVVRDAEFMKTLLLVGLAGKIAIAGVVMFAIPIILAGKGFASEDIGQALMLYYIASIIVTRYASKMVDYLGTSRSILFFSTVIGGVGMFLVGIVGIEQNVSNALLPGGEMLSTYAVLFNQIINDAGLTYLNNYLIITGILLAGISNGLLAAPVMTHIDKTKVAHEYGNKSVAATYLFLERGGHVVGPLVVHQLLVYGNQSPIGIALFGILTILLGMIFVVTSQQS